VTGISNDLLALKPVTSFSGPALDFDWEAVRVGVAEYAEGPTGCTVLHFPAGVQVAIDVRGGSPGFIGDYGYLDAICLAGGSLYGLEAATGVAAELFAQRDYTTQWDRLALVSGAIVFDFGRRDNAIYPDKTLGRAALRAAQTGRFPLGPRGAGACTRVGAGPGGTDGEPGGQGAAFRQIGEVKLGVFTVVNALGAIVDRQGNRVRGHLDRETGKRYRLEDEAVRRLEEGRPAQAASGNTTLTVVVTNLTLDQRTLQQVGRQVHASLARAIQPFHTLFDGDILYMASTRGLESQAISAAALGALASELAWDAVLSCY
jgi:L-aminopeptidase/D-esterase-like protein